MLFNSIAFAIFLPIVYFLYWAAASKRLWIQNTILLAASYVFYGWWDYRFLFLLAFSTLLDYFSGLKIYNSSKPRTRKIYLVLSVLINVGILCFFKYYNFFAGSIAALTGMRTHLWAINILLPVGISFYTFHGLSYVYDIYKQRCRPAGNLAEYALFVGFFPLLVAGPIERARHLLPQIKMPRIFDYTAAADGLRQILWGLFKKVVVADNCAHDVSMIFDHPANYSGSTLFYGAVLFAFQIYGDFSGYSDIAIGTARLFGFNIVRNFSYPYFSRNLEEFWRRWNISVSTWFRDYVYVPLGGRYGSKWQQARNALVMFMLIGLWHGANWTFLLLGLFNGLLFLPRLLIGKNKKESPIVAAGKVFPSLKEALQIGTTFLIITMGCVLFRSGTVMQAFNYFKGLFSMSFFTQPQIFSNLVFKVVLIMVVVEWLQRDKQYGLQIGGIKFVPVRWSMYIALMYCIFYYPGPKQEFIYFQF